MLSLFRGVKMLTRDFREYMLELRLNFYDFFFLFGLLGFFVVYALTSSFDAAITLAAFSWVISIVIFIIYYFELGDVNDYLRDLKKRQRLSLKERILRLPIVFVILLFLYAGAMLFIFIGLYFFGNNIFINGISAVIGMTFGIKVFMILKRIFPRSILSILRRMR
jgi:hypothetical protein